MRKTLRRILILAMLVSAAMPLWASGGEGGGAAKAFTYVPTGTFTIESLDLHLKLAKMKEAGPPLVLENYLVLSAKGPYRYVAAAFASEGFAKVHPFDKNEQGVFLLALPVPLKRSEPIAYRLIVDGAWMADPRNPQAVYMSGAEVSIATVPYLTDEKPGLYHILGLDGTTAHFLFKGEPGLYVTVAGTFNNWDPFLYEMAETRPGVYELGLRLPPGQHYYAFYYDGSPHPDPLNEEKATSQDGVIVSALLVGPRG